MSNADCAGSVRAVSQDGNTSCVTLPGDLGDRQDQRALRRDVVDHREPGFGTDRRDDRIHQLCGRTHRIRRDRGSQDTPALACGERGRLCHAAISEIGHQNLVTRFQRERSQDGVGAGRGVVDEHEIVTARAKEFGDDVSRLTHARFIRPRTANDDGGELAQEVVAGPPLDVVADRLLCRQDAMRRDADGAVIQIRDARLQRPFRQHGFPERARRARFQMFRRLHKSALRIVESRECPG